MGTLPLHIFSGPRSSSSHSQNQGVRSTPKGHRFHHGGAREYITTFLKKCDEDLNTILVSVSPASCLSPHVLILGGQASLMTAVVSAFIIYVHPKLQPDPDEDTAALLRVLLYKINNTIFGDDVPEAPRWTGPPLTIVATQLLLYLSLAATLGSVLFAIVTKELLNVCTLTGTWRSLAEDVRNQQLRLKWFTLSLHVIIFTLSALLQSALLLCSCAVTVYLWKINILIASVLLASILCVVSIHGIIYGLVLVNTDFSRFWTTNLFEL